MPELDAETTATTIGALSGVMMAAAFVCEPDVWPGFIAYVERMNGGREMASSPRVMDLAIQVTDAMRSALSASLGREPGEPIVLRVIIAVSREFRMGELIEAASG